MLKRLVRRIASRLNPYNQLTRGVQRIEYQHAALLTEGYYSQCGQDKYIAETLLPGKSGGVFLDIGAHDGVAFSNTFYFEKHQGRSGVAVEPLPGPCAELQANRACSVINACVSARTGKSRLRVLTGYTEMLSGLTDYYDPRHLARIERESREFGGSTEEIEVDCLTLNQIVSDYHLRHVDYLSIDVEGAELAILSAFDFSSCTIDIIGVENNYADYHIGRLLKKHGFTLRAIVGGDEFYVKS